MPGYFAPTAQGTPDGNFSGGANGINSDNVRAISWGVGPHSYTAFNFSIPAGNQITGIEVKLEVGHASADMPMLASLSWNNGGNYTGTKDTGTLISEADTIYTLGGAGDLWGRTWTIDELNNGNFILRLEANPVGGATYLDAIRVRAYHQTTGGGSGGGGRL